MLDCVAFMSFRDIINVLSLYQRTKKVKAKHSPLITEELFPESAIMWAVSSDRWAISGNFWVVRVEKYLKLQPLVSCTCGILPQIITTSIIILWVKMDSNIIQTLHIFQTRCIIPTRLYPSCILALWQCLSFTWLYLNPRFSYGLSISMSIKPIPYLFVSSQPH
jgi:hypothetical protein